MPLSIDKAVGSSLNSRPDNCGRHHRTSLGGAQLIPASAEKASGSLNLRPAYSTQWDPVSKTNKLTNKKTK